MAHTIIVTDTDSVPNAAPRTYAASTLPALRMALDPFATLEHLF